jgi:uncharacterized protein (TIGR00725 family)
MNITVFGGANPLPGDAAYSEALNLGRLLGEAGHTVLTGGFVGTMEAASRGAAEAGAHVVGITCKDIETWRGVKANPWVQEERSFANLRERLFALIDGCDAAIALPGGAGTLAEISIMWNQMIVEAIPARPLILVGSGWKNTFETMYANFELYTKARDRQHLTFVADVDTAVRELTLLLESQTK